LDQSENKSELKNMRKIDALLSEYGKSHQNATNKTIHWICVPLIFFSIVALIASIPADPLEKMAGENDAFTNWATIVLLLATVYYVSLSIPLAIGLLLFAVGCLQVAFFIGGLNILPLWQSALIIFVLAWIGQFYGHKIEGKKPSFLKDIQFLLIGPAWLMHFIYKKIRIPY
jgi:uncharacterized membrane protein YGL010W